jgi:hypothetical protein
MGVLHHRDGGVQPLGSRTLVGRAPGCELQLDDPRVSGEHATVWWTGLGWSVRDLGSRNGTWVDGRRLEPGEAAPLRAGATLSFAGDEAQYVLEDDGPPVAWARSDGGARVQGSGTLLALPDAAAPAVTVYRATGGWLAESAEGTVPVGTGRTVQAEGSEWILSLPDALPPTVETAGPPSLDDIVLRLIVSRDEETVELVLQTPAGERSLGCRSHLDTVLYLARRRLADGHLPEPVQGWVLVEQALDELRITENRLNVHVYRMRQQLAEAGIDDAHRVIERRPRAMQLRLGTARVEVIRP